MSGALAELASTLLPSLLQGAASSAGSEGGADLFSKLAGGGNSGAGGSGGASAGDGGASGSAGDNSGGVGSSGGPADGQAGDPTAGLVGQLQGSADQTLAAQDPGGFLHEQQDIQKGDGNAAARDLAQIVHENPSSQSLQQAAGILAATIGTDADQNGGGKLSGAATKELQQALPNAQIDVGGSALGKLGSDLTKGLNSAIGGIGSGLGSLTSGVGDSVGKGLSSLGSVI